MRVPNYLSIRLVSDMGVRRGDGIRNQLPRILKSRSAFSPPGSGISSPPLPVYAIVSLGCYGLLMVGVGLMMFPTCPQEAVLLQKDIVEAKEFLKRRGVDVGSD
ncbi:dolichol-phosphate mannose synthase subunit 3 [Canna indica]|uniref:Dolichol-phosphate mannosyltransferase subunit 3 n=1 Tax=Canna indica TaxID=4628 RepID=A0AAQ3QRH1_9LILI|nr:dolichol-phosphate mannose synthase subunit 3 [Canna indica]